MVRRLPSPGFSVYLTAGWPSPPAFLELASAVAGCIDFLEIGLPARNPLYDGPVIRETHRRAVELGVGLEEAVKLARRAASSTGRPVILMGYISELGSVERAVEAAAAAEAESLLAPDLLFEMFSEVEAYVEASRSRGLEPSFFASSRFPHGVLRRLASLKPLLVYLGLQPATGVRLPVAMARNVSLAKSIVGGVYLVAGFSIKSKDDAEAMYRAGADAVVVGSEVVRAYLRGGVGEAARRACEISGGARG
jgi:tryptophan synthase alpha chain